MSACPECAGYGHLHRQDTGAHGLTVPCSKCAGTGQQQSCERCDRLVDHKHGHLCSACIAEEMDYDENDCANCGGEGFTYGCDWDWQCDTWDGDSCLCTRRCEWCQPLAPAELAQREQLRALMADALATPTPKKD